MPQYFIEEIKNDLVVFSSEQSHHLRDVLRCNIDDVVRVVDPTGKVYLVTITQLLPAIIARIIKSIEVNEEGPFIRLLPVLIKKEKWEWLLQKAVEFGVSEIVPLFSERCVIKLNPRDILKKVNRWNKITKEACQQCLRNLPVEVKTPIPLTMVSEFTADIKIVAYEEAAIIDHLANFLQDKKIGSINIIIGPEGGLAVNEVNQLLTSNYQPVSLGRRILRSESAGIYSLVTIDNWLRKNR